MSIVDRLLKRMDKPTTVGTIMAAAAAKKNPYVAAALAEALDNSEDQATTPSSTEMARICALPVRTPVIPEQLDALSHLEVDALSYEEGFRLHADQLDAIYEYDNTGGLLAQIRVGGGKTIISVMIASRAFTAGRKKIIIMIPSSVNLQFMQMDLPWIRPRIPLACKFFGFGGRSPAARAILARSGPGCYVLPYGLLSQQDARDILNEVNPDLIIADEAQNLKRKGSARTKRVLDFLSDHPDTQFCAMSGTLTSKSILDYQHLARHALKDKSPLPVSANQAAEWSAILDASAMPSPANAAKLAPLRLWASEQTGEPIPTDADGYRKSFQVRLRTAPGVVLSGKDDLGTSLVYHNIKGSKPGDELEGHLEKLRGEWVSPDGDEIAHAIQLFKWEYELAAGFYNSLVWPDPEVFAANNGLSAKVANARLDAAKTQHNAQNKYNSVLRGWLDQTSIPGLDTPLLVAQNISRGNQLVPFYVREAYEYAQSLKFSAMPTRKANPVRVDDYKILAAVEWAKHHHKHGGIIWIYHKEISNWVGEALTEAGIDPLVCEAGRQGSLDILSPENKHRICVATIKGHGVGKNLQHFEHQLFVQWPRPAQDAEQAVGRTHRPGQLADELIIDMLCWTSFDQMNFAACLNDALYAELTTGVQQKLLYGNYDPPPIVFSSRVLQTQGFQNKALVSGALESRFAA